MSNVTVQNETEDEEYDRLSIQCKIAGCGLVHKENICPNWARINEINTNRKVRRFCKNVCKWGCLSNTCPCWVDTAYFMRGGPVKIVYFGDEMNDDV